MECGNRLRVGVLVLKTHQRVGVCVSALLSWKPRLTDPWHSTSFFVALGIEVKSLETGTVVSKFVTDRHFSFFLGDTHFELQIQNRAARRIETDLWKCQQKISHYRYRFSLEVQLISITDTDLGSK